MLFSSQAHQPQTQRVFHLKASVPCLPSQIEWRLLLARAQLTADLEGCYSPMQRVSTKSAKKFVNFGQLGRSLRCSNCLLNVTMTPRSSSSSTLSTPPKKRKWKLGFSSSSFWKRNSKRRVRNFVSVFFYIAVQNFFMNVFIDGFCNFMEHCSLRGFCLGKRRRTFSPGESQIPKSIWGRDGFSPVCAGCMPIYCMRTLSIQAPCGRWDAQREEYRYYVETEVSGHSKRHGWVAQCWMSSGKVMRGLSSRNPEHGVQTHFRVLNSNKLS